MRYRLAAESWKDWECEPTGRRPRPRSLLPNWRSARVSIPPLAGRVAGRFGETFGPPTAGSGDPRRAPVQILRRQERVFLPQATQELLGRPDTGFRENNGHLRRVPQGVSR